MMKKFFPTKIWYEFFPNVANRLAIAIKMSAQLQNQPKKVINENFFQLVFSYKINNDVCILLFVTQVKKNLQSASASLLQLQQHKSFQQIILRCILTHYFLCYLCQTLILDDTLDDKKNGDFFIRSYLIHNKIVTICEIFRVSPSVCLLRNIGN